MKYIEKSGDCWLWTGAKIGDGYGSFNINGKMFICSRLMYIHCFGQIEDGYEIAHTPIICHNRACVNPEHLEAKTCKDNQADRVLDKTNPIGERNNNSKLTKVQVCEIRRRSTENHRLLGLEFGVSKSTIGRVLKRKLWKHI